MIDLSIIIITYNSSSDIGACLHSIVETGVGVRVEVFVVDNNSSDDTLDVIRRDFPMVNVIANDFNAGFPGANNQAIRLAGGRYVMLINPDTVVHPGAFRAIVDYMDQHPGCGICGPELVDQDGKVYVNLWKPSLALEIIHTFRLTGLLRRDFPDERVQVVSGACLVARRSVFDSIGLLDGQMHSCEDSDFCVRAREAGYQVRVVRKARVMHIKGQSEKTNPSYVTMKQYSSRILFYKKHAGNLERDLVFQLLYWQVILRVFKLRLVCAFAPSERAREHLHTLITVRRGLPAQFRDSVNRRDSVLGAK
ncbi:MAG TPA: glycosyltransferase family 2 protein [Armatimonadota bacterium]|jgi:hypothetical protein